MSPPPLTHTFVGLTHAHVVIAIIAETFGKCGALCALREKLAAAAQCLIFIMFSIFTTDIVAKQRGKDRGKKTPLQTLTKK